MNDIVGMNIELKSIYNGFDFESCWVGPGTAVDSESGFAVLGMARLDLSGSDVFDGSHFAYSTDFGASWTEPTKPDVFSRRPLESGGSTCCGVFPVWHAPSRQMLGFGHVINYTQDDVVDHHHSRPIAISRLDIPTRTWSAPVEIPVPAEIELDYTQVATQFVTMEDGDILMPISVSSHPDLLFTTYVTQLRLNGTSAEIVKWGNGLSVAEPRGLYEPALMKFRGRYYMTLRNDITGYVTVSDDGFEYETPGEWCFDDGQSLGNYNTQQRWVNLGDEELYLVYTRRGGDNDNVFRHRAPLFIAQVDPERLCILRDSEQVLVPNRGARLGNFSICKVSEDESWVMAAEWMQNDTAGFGRVGAEYCVSFGSDNNVFLAKVSR